MIALTLTAIFFGAIGFLVGHHIGTTSGFIEGMIEGRQASRREFPPW